MDIDDMAIFEGVWGEMHVEKDVFKTVMDIIPYLKGLPNDDDPCPHCGIVVKGKIEIMSFNFGSIRCHSPSSLEHSTES